MNTQQIQPTGALRAWGWPLLAVGILMLLIVWPLFTFAFVTSMGTDDNGLMLFIARAAPIVGLALIGAAITLLVIASKRAAANREAAQTAALMYQR